MIKLSKEGISKSQKGQKLRPHVPVSQVMNAKEKSLKEIKKCYSSEHMNNKEAK